MFMHARNVIFFIILIKFILSLHLVEYGKQNLRLFQVFPCVLLGSHEFQDFYGILWDIKSWVGSSWSSVSSSVHAGIHQHVCHPIWSSVLSRCTSLLHSPCPCSKASSGASYLPITFLPVWWMRDIILFPVILETQNCYRSLCADRTSYIIGRAE